MRSLRYLNSVLTLIAVLLSLHLWTMWTAPMTGSSRPAIDFATEAHAVPNAAEQRIATVNELKKTTAAVQGLADLFKSGKARVRVEGDGGKTK